MADYLVIRLGADDTAAWMRVDSAGTRKSNVSTGALDTAARESGDLPVIVLVPAADVLLTTVHIPARGASRIRSALPFALEEHVVDDVENLHFAVGGRQDDGRLPVAVVSRARLDDWLARLSDAGIEPVRVVAENQGLAKIPGTMSMLVDGPSIAFNDGANLEFCLDDCKPSDLLVAAGRLGERASDDDDTGHLTVFCSADDQSRFEHDWNALRHELNSVDINLLPDGALPRLAATVATGRGVNLLQGSYSRAPEYAALLQPWKMAAALLLVLGLSAFIAKGVEVWQLGQEQAALKAQFTTEYRQIRPGDTRDIVDPEGTVNSLRRAAGSSAAAPLFLESLAALGAAVSEQSDANIEAISYRAGVVDIRLSAPSVPTLDAIQRSIGQSGQFEAVIQSADQVGDSIDGRIQIRESGS